MEREGEEESQICSDLVLEQINWTGRHPLLSVLDIPVHALIRCIKRVTALMHAASNVRSKKTTMIMTVILLYKLITSELKGIKSINR